jgi:tryptophan-rich sensory protein
MAGISTFFGIPYPIVGFICFILAGIFTYVWPKTKAKGVKNLTLPTYILHYFHPLAWVLLGMAAFMQARFPDAAAIFGGLGVIVYVAFVVVLLRA